jgi:precorrin-6A/cobalt-precorrin-6A reductase
MQRILLLSGTCEGLPLARALLAAGFQVRATVTRPEAKENLFGSLVGQASRLSVEVRGFTEQSLEAFLGRGEADLVLDATHPFAVRISRIAWSVCERIRMPYVRYERPDWTPPAGTHFVDSYAAAAVVLPSLGSRPMLTIGVKQLKHFASLHGRLTMYARILPSPLSLRQALEAGFVEENLLRLQPPFSLERNRELFRQYNVDVLVTKASGREGGVVEKVTAACERAMKVLMIRRPDPLGLCSMATIDEAVHACRALLDRAAEPSGE